MQLQVFMNTKDTPNNLFQKSLSRCVIHADESLSWWSNEDGKGRKIHMGKKMKQQSIS